MIDLPILTVDAATKPAAPSTKRFWRSPAHLHQDPTFVEHAQHEFMPGAADKPTGASRRQFLQLMGASMAMAGLTACRRPVETIMPYARKPEEQIPGIPLFYATAMPLQGSVRPLLVESHDGRPTKVETNPDHPYSSGGSGIFEQASVLNLYDPDRSKTVLRNGSDASWDDFLGFCASVAADPNQRVVVLSEATSSPTIQGLQQQLQTQFPNAQWVTYHQGGDDAVALGMQQAFGQPVRPVYHFQNAQVIVSFDADFTGPTDPNGENNASTFAESRRLASPSDTMSRLYVVESAYTATGSMADHRKRLRASDIPHFAAAVAGRLGVGLGSTQFADDPHVAAIASDLQAAGTNGVVLAGETQPPIVHALCAALNAALGSTVVEYLDPGSAAIQPQADTLSALVQDMQAGNVDLLLMLGVNPVYNAPASLDFATALSQVRESVHVGQHEDETARASSWHLPQTHYLEAWGDGRTYDGTLSVIQPLIAPLYADAHSDIEILSALVTGGDDQTGYDIVRAQWQTVFADGFEAAWRKTLHDGFVPDTRYATAALSAAAPNLTTLPSVDEDDLEVVFRLDPTVLDGAFANNAWCQEVPDPMTKIVWDNVAVMSPATAEHLGVHARYSKGNYYSDIIELTVGGRTVQLPVWEMPGHPDFSIQVNLGYGRDITSHREPRTAPFFDTNRHTDVYGDGAIATGIGTNVAPLRPTPGTSVVLGVQVSATGGTYEVVTTQDHGALDPEARALFRMATLEEYRANPTFVEEMYEPTPGEPFEDYPMLWEDDHPQNTTTFKDNLYYKNQWGMVIDLNTCNGCNACVVACNSENNIQVIGKEQVSHGREAHWLRLDRYFITEGGSEDEDVTADPQAVIQPMMCQHCENAPCESVCPVSATVHSPDGTNQMIYNRCIGTRYCSNNCPYKVRRYNWFNWTATLPTEVQMAQNPNVTMRFRGVMEKCSWCVQRIREGQRNANVEERPLNDGEIQTACQQACSADAIIFGDLNDPNSRVNQLKADPRNYEMLAQLNVKPRLSYLARVRNPNPALETVA